MPTGIEKRYLSTGPSMSKTSSRLSGVFTAKSLVPLGDSARGLTCPLSKATNEEGVMPSACTVVFRQYIPRKKEMINR
jgi:hypothetical protein